MTICQGRQYKNANYAIKNFKCGDRRKLCAWVLLLIYFTFLTVNNVKLLWVLNDLL